MGVAYDYDTVIDLNVFYVDLLIYAHIYFKDIGP